MDIRDPWSILTPGMIKSYVDREVNRALSGTGVTASAAFFLMLIGRQEGLSVGRLTAAAMADKSLASRSVRRLMDCGCVEDRGSGAQHTLFLTAEGRRVEGLARAELRRIRADLLADADDGELRALASVMLKIRARMEGAGRRSCAASAAGSWRRSPPASP